METDDGQNLVEVLKDLMRYSFDDLKSSAATLLYCIYNVRMLFIETLYILLFIFRKKNLCLIKLI